MKDFYFLLHQKTKFWSKKCQLLCLRRIQDDVSGLLIFYVDIHMELTPFQHPDAPT